MKNRKFLNVHLLLIIFSILILGNSIQAQIIASEDQSTITPEYFQIPNTKIELIPPAHFRFMEQMNGFLHVGTSSSIQIQEIRGTAYPMIVQGLTEGHFTSQGVTLISKEEVLTSNGQKAVIFTVAFKVDDFEFERLMFFSGDYNNTIWINANYPVVMKEILNVVLKESLLTARFIN
ncbi:MAG: hypothetical protein PHT69_05155 [Bacteroidales bacterium]|nr:hypothetical protein [Bacteroidales bacterium]